MINTKYPDFEKSTAPSLCKRCDGVGSVWIYSKEHSCERCKGKGTEPETSHKKDQNKS